MIQCIEARAAIQLDLALAFPIIEVVLGGTGSDTIEPRDLTEIEEQILVTVVRLIVQGVQYLQRPGRAERAANDLARNIGFPAILRLIASRWFFGSMRIWPGSRSTS